MPVRPLAVGRPLAPDVAAAWLYVMPRRGEEEVMMRRALAEKFWLQTVGWRER